ncbi:MAG TPA: gluconokinase [Burkholderiaceae bacterium]|nr:gluconokinase [Burkholderiaceae bacterium]
MSAPCIVVMGVCGCGKTTVGRLLAQALGLPFVEGDDLHPPRNVALMAAGTALTDDDRREWLARVADVLAEAARGTGAVVSCSALRRSYRDRLRAGAPGMQLVWLHGAPALLAERLAGRSGHYMPPTLLPSQLATLEPPAPDELALALDIAAPVAELADAARRHFEKAHA